MPAKAGRATRQLYGCALMEAAGGQLEAGHPMCLVRGAYLAGSGNKDEGSWQFNMNQVLAIWDRLSPGLLLGFLD